MSDMPKKKVTEVATRRCPKCGSTLLTNGNSEWCSYIGSTGQREHPWDKSCDYGIASPVPLQVKKSA